ncbi:MAG: two-component regulator propeller domain-containing protein, partial [Bacteroidota bacterium]
MLRRFSFIVLVLFPAAVPLLSQTPSDYTLDPAKSISQYVHSVWQTENGLPQNTVTSVLQTQDGYLWLATLEGLVRFDGAVFTVFNKRSIPTLKSNRIWCLLEDRNSNLW